MNPFTFDHDFKRRYLKIVIAGFWTADDLERFKAEAAAVLKQAVDQGAKSGEGRILINASGFGVQDKSLTDQISQFIPTYGKLAKKIAVVGSSSALQRLQIKRVVGENGAVFEHEHEATDWLFG